MTSPIYRHDNGQSTIDKSSTDYTERLLALMECKLALVESLHMVSTSHRAISLGEDVSVTLGVIARRDAIVDQLLEVQLEMRTYQGDDPEQRVWVSPDRRQRCRSIAAKIDQVIKEVIQLDSQTLDAMCQQRDSIAAELRHGLDSNLTQQAYAANDTLQPSLLDISDL